MLRKKQAIAKRRFASGWDAADTTTAFFLVSGAEIATAYLATSPLAVGLACAPLLPAGVQGVMFVVNGKKRKTRVERQAEGA